MIATASEAVASTPDVSRDLIYFETSAWNRLADNPRREDLIACIRRRGLRVVTGVYAAGEVLSTANDERRRTLCETVTQASDGEAPLLDHPEYLAIYAADAWRKGETDFLEKESSGARRLRSFLESPDRLDAASRDGIVQWIREGPR